MKKTEKTNNSYDKITERMLEFIDESPTCFHVVENLRKRLISEGFYEL